MDRERAQTFRCAFSRRNRRGHNRRYSRFRDPERVKQIEDEVKAYEDRVQETARALDQKQRLEEKINELNSLTGSPLTQKETTNKNSNR